MLLSFVVIWTTPSPSYVHVVCTCSLKWIWLDLASSLSDQTSRTSAWLWVSGLGGCSKKTPKWPEYRYIFKLCANIAVKKLQITFSNLGILNATWKIWILFWQFWRFFFLKFRKFLQFQKNWQFRQLVYILWNSQNAGLRPAMLAIAVSVRGKRGHIE